MNEIKAAKTEVKRCEGLSKPIHDLSITAKQCAVIDFVGQLCNEYEIPHSRGLNIRYTRISESRIQVSVEIPGKLGKTRIEFLAQKSKGNYGWEVYTPANFPCSVHVSGYSNKNNFKVVCDLNGKYRFPPLAPLA